MKKILIAGAALALTTAFSAQANNFGKMNVGIKLDYAMTSLDDGDTNELNDLIKPKTLGASLFVNKGFLSGDMHYGVELQTGYGFTKTSTTKNVLKLDANRLFNFGLSGRIGTVMDNVLLYARLGVNMVQYKLKVTNTSTSASASTKQFFANVVPGVGAEFEVGNGINLRLEYNYEQGLTSKKPFKEAGGDFKWKAQNAHVISVGASMAF